MSCAVCGNKRFGRLVLPSSCFRRASRSKAAGCFVFVPYRWLSLSVLSDVGIFRVVLRFEDDGE